MSGLVVRPFEERDSDAFFEVLSLTYNDGVPIPEERKRFRFSRGYVVENEGKVSGGLMVLEFTCSRGAALLKCGAIAAVAVDPQFRRMGVGSGLLSGIVRQLRSEGVHLSSLYAFRESWYRRFGYEVCGKRVQIVCPTHRLPKGTSGLEIRRLGPSDWLQIAPCYEAYAHARSGMNVRSEAMWERFLNEHKPNMVYAAGDPVEGYVAISHQVAFWEQQQLTEVAWSSPRGYRACLEALHMLGINKSAMAWYEPSDSPFLACHLDQGIETKLSRPIMFRLNDVPSSLALLVPEADGEFCMRVRDDVVPENDGVWTVRFAPGKVEVVAGGEPDFTIDIRQLTQAFLGEPSLDDLVRVGLLDIHRAEGLSAARALMPPSPTYCGDFF